jgi:hypothetical protein
VRAVREETAGKTMQGVRKSAARPKSNSIWNGRTHREAVLRASRLRYRKVVLLKVLEVDAESVMRALY